VPGLPDLLLVGSAACCWRELKCGSTRVTAVQASWLDALEAAGQDVAVWSPRDLADGTIRAELEALNQSRPARHPAPYEAYPASFPPGCDRDTDEPSSGLVTTSLASRLSQYKASDKERKNEFHHCANEPKHPPGTRVREIPSEDCQRKHHSA